MSYRSTKADASQAIKLESGTKSNNVDLDSIRDASKAAEYIRGIVDPLQKLAARNGLEVLSYLLRMTEEEATSAIKTGKSVAK